ncbi:MAG: hypothetical protein R3301_16300, partial [Saprospiraceae bacterium]|nr:hypothetical protein [Saprospiraceae bacterium]
MGLLIPRLTTAQRDSINQPAEGLLVYDVDTGSFWYRQDSSWVDLNEVNRVFENANGTVRNTGDHVSDDFVFGSPQLDDDGVTDHRARMFFDKDKRAFRVGTTRDTANSPFGIFDSGDAAIWDQDSLGRYSFAAGVGARATGETSISLGNSSWATGNSAVALGFVPKALGDFSLAAGWSASASGPSAAAIGRQISASGETSMVLGSGIFSLFGGAILENDIPNSLMVGFNSDLPTLFVGPSSGQGTIGKVGIGTTSPLENLVVGNDLGGYSGTRISIGEDGGFSGMNIGENANDRAFMLFNPTHHYLYFGMLNGGMIYNNNLVLRDGKVGIRTEDPQDALHVDNGLIRLSSMNNTGIRTYVNNTLSGTFESVNSHTAMKAHSRNLQLIAFEGQLNFYTSRAGSPAPLRMRIDSTGFIGMGKGSATDEPKEDLVVGEDLGGYFGTRIVVGDAFGSSG